MAIKHDFSLDAKYRQLEGQIFLSGIQALVRLPLDQHRADKRRGLNTATMISGYRGSPLGGLDLTLERNPELLREHNVTFVSGVNEDLGATVVYGSQLANLFPNPKYDGVLGMWYGKGPGVDRTGDIFKHANYAGVGKNGGVLALGGDDPFSKSSTLPTHSEVAFSDALFPVVFPGNVQEILDLGRLGFELSRYSGLWVGFKIVTNVADEIGTALIGPTRITVRDPGFLYGGQPWHPTQNTTLLPPFSLDMEREIHYGRLEAAKAFAAVNGLNTITVPTSKAWLGIAAPGKTYYDLREALVELGLDDTALERYGIRLLRIGMLFPMEPGIVREFARGLEEVLVVEEKRAFVELFIRDVLYNLNERPVVVGKRDLTDRPLVPANGELDADRIALIVASRLERRVQLGSITARVALLEALRERPAPLTIARASVLLLGLSAQSFDGRPRRLHGQCRHRLPRHGAGLARASDSRSHPHGRRGRAVGGDGALHRDAAHVPEHRRRDLLSFGLAGDPPGSGRGHPHDLQDPLQLCGGDDRGPGRGGGDAGARADPHARGGGRQEDPGGDGRAGEVSVGHGVGQGRRGLAPRPSGRGAAVLREVPGVTVLVYDQRCAAEKRRLRKRGKLPDPAQRVYINEAVCEGCGDCGVKSNCLSVHPVETEFGRKTQIHQSSCNKDYSCLRGDCPSFLTVVPLGEPTNKERKLYKVERTLPAPTLRVPAQSNVYMMGIGGTGVVTVNQILGTAALLEGKHVRGLDQTGLSQKGGPVVSHLKIASAPHEGSNKIAAGEADCYLGFDILVATSAVNLDHAGPERTIAVVSTSQVPTGAMVTHTDVHFPETNGLLQSINRLTRKDENVYLDALGLAEQLFGDHMAANLIVLGAAYQAGAIAVSAEAIEEAIVLNGVSVTMNTHAFRAGRLAVLEPAALERERKPRLGAVAVTPALSAEARALVEGVGASGELGRLLSIRVPELIAYQSVAYAREYAEFVKRIFAAEPDGRSAFSEGVARNLFKLMAYKDEYEVARLHLASSLSAQLAAEYPSGVRLHYHLHPPILRALGWQKKIKLGTWFNGVFRLLATMKGLRGTPLDPFGRAEVRRLERALIGEYRGWLEKAMAGLSPESYERAVKLATLPDLIRGYEDVKLESVKRFRHEVRALGF